MLNTRSFVVSAIVLLIGSNVQAGAIPLINPSFEDPAGDKTVGDATWSNIAGWTATGPSVDSGIEAFSSEPQPDLGANIAFLQSGDGAIYQTSGYTIQSGDSFGLSFYERNDFEADELTIRFYYDDGGARTVFDTQTIAFSNGIERGGPLAIQALTAAATAPSVGFALGIEFENTSLDGTEEWGWIDNVSLTRVPESASIVLLLMCGAVRCWRGRLV